MVREARPAVAALLLAIHLACLVSKWNPHQLFNHPSLYSPTPSIRSQGTNITALCKTDQVLVFCCCHSVLFCGPELYAASSGNIFSQVLTFLPVNLYCFLLFES